MNILLCNGGFINKGAEAMLKTVQVQLSKRIDGITLWHENKGKPIKIDSSCRSIDDTFKNKTCETVWQSRFFRLFAMFYGKGSLLDRYQASEAAVSLRNNNQFDAILDISGFAYSSQQGDMLTNKALLFSRFFKQNSLPRIFLPQTWGPFDDVAQASNVKKLLQDATLYYARDERSLAYLSELLGVQQSAIPLSPDIAFLFEGGSQKEGNELIKKAGLSDLECLKIGLFPNMRIYERMKGEGADNEYCRLLVSIVAYCRKEFNAVVLLLPHEIRPEHHFIKDDRFLCCVIKNRFEDDNGVVSFTHDYSSEQIKAVTGHCSLVIGSRFHGLIAALSLSIPTIALGWAHKYNELMATVGLDDAVFDYDNISSEELCGKIRDRWDEKEKAGKLLGHTIPKLKLKVENVFNEIAESLSGWNV